MQAVSAPPSNGDLPREPVYRRIARFVQRWSARPESQGGDARAVVDAAVTNDGLILVNSSRSILYAHDGADFAEAAVEAAAELQEALGGAIGLRVGVVLDMLGVGDCKQSRFLTSYANLIDMGFLQVIH